MAAKFKLVKTGRTWSIVNVATDAIVEGGFFYKHFALAALSYWNGGGM